MGKLCAILLPPYKKHAGRQTMRPVRVTMRVVVESKLGSNLAGLSLSIDTISGRLLMEIVNIFLVCAMTGYGPL